MFTPEGWAWVANQVADVIRAGAVVVVADESNNSAIATIGNVSVDTLDSGGTRVVVSATFAEKEANFEWLNHSIKLADNTVLDREVEDLGRKAEGSEWDIEVGIDFGVPA